MANQILIDPYPYGVDVTQRGVLVSGMVALAGSAVSTGEPLNWANMITGVGYNDINFAGVGGHGTGTSLVTAFSGSGTVVTATANNNFSVGQTLSFVGCTSAMGVKLNGTTAVVATASASQFTFASTLTDDGSSEVGLAISGRPAFMPALAGPSLTATVTAISASGTTLTVTAANNFMPGAQVLVNVSTGTLGPKLAGLYVPVIQSTGTAFTATMPSALTGTTGTGTAVGQNCPQPFSVRFWSDLASGYTYQYNGTFGTLFVMDVIATGTSANPTITTTTNAGTTTPVYTNGGALTQVAGATGITGVIAGAFTGSAAALQKLAAAAYPSGVLNDVVRFEARFTKDR